MSNQYPWPRIAGRDPDLRAGDADRERTAERLRTSHAEGRLDMAEFQQRLDRCLQARTLGELDELVGDLPGQDERAGRPASGWSRPGRWGPSRVALLVLALIIVSAAAGHHAFLLWIPFTFLLWRISWGWRRRRWAGVRRGPGDWT